MLHIINAIIGTVAHSKYSTLVADARLTILDRLVLLFQLSKLGHGTGHFTRETRNSRIRALDYE